MARGVLLEITPLAELCWSTVRRQAIHSTFVQGYDLLVAGTLRSPLWPPWQAPRLMMMPIDLLSTGINSSLMLPLTAGWLGRGVGRVGSSRRLVLGAIGVALLSMIYLAVMWLLGRWTFTRVLHSSFPSAICC